MAYTVDHIRDVYADGVPENCDKDDYVRTCLARIDELEGEAVVAAKHDALLHGRVAELEATNDRLIKLSPIPDGEPCPLCGYVSFAAIQALSQQQVEECQDWPSIEERDMTMADEDS